MDDVSKAIGRLEADMESSQRQRETLFKLNKETNENVAKLTAMMGSFTTEVRAALQQHSAEIAKHEQEIGVLKKFKTRALIAVAGVGGTGGVLGGLASKFTSFLSGGGGH